MIRSSLATIGAVMLCLAPVALAAQEQVAATQYALPETEVWDMQAEHGETYRIYVSRPEGEAPEQGYPVLYVLDGNAMFAGFAEARRLQGAYNGDREKLIVVGIGYPNTELYDGRRLGDFTAPLHSRELRERYKNYPSGRRDLFEAFLMDRLRPEIARRYPIDAARQSLFGHSLGGLFGLHMLYSRPGVFHTIIAASPSIWWDNQAILDEEVAFRKRIAHDSSLARSSRILILTGENEEAKVTVSDSIALAERLETMSRWGLRSEFELLADETHMTVPSRAVTPTLRYAMQHP